MTYALGSSLIDPGQTVQIEKDVGFKGLCYEMSTKMFTSEVV